MLINCKHKRKYMHNPFEDIFPQHEYLSILDDIDATTRQVSTVSFAKELEFTWGAGMLIAPEHVEAVKSLSLPFGDGDEAKVRTDIASYEPTLALLNMGEYGYGVIATDF